MTYKTYNKRNYKSISHLSRLTEEQKKSIGILSQIFPFKTNNYVVDELIDWDNFETDPLYILNFPQKEMLKEDSYNYLQSLLDSKASKEDVNKLVTDIRLQMNPHPAGQLEHNVPSIRGEKILGIQHKYRETALFFPSQGQTCHAYCTFCFRWPQFAGISDIKFAMKQTNLLIEYLRQNPEITDLLITGGDPMVMSSKIFEKYIDAILKADLPNLKSIRIGTKSLTFWPYRYTEAEDAEALLNVFRKIVDSGLHLAFMAHFNHYNELKTSVLEEAVKKIRSTGAEIRTQAPILKHINASSEILEKLWRKQVDLGMVPYYMFMARDTGAQEYFGVPIAQALEIFQGAYRSVSGICRTVRGPSMSASPGKVHIIGTTVVNGEKVFVLQFLQGRISSWVGNPFFAKFDLNALWLDDLNPAFGEKEFFYEKEYRKLLKINTLPGHSIKAEDLQSA